MPKHGPDRERVPDAETHIFIESMFGLFGKRGRVKLELVDGDRRIHVLLDPAEAVAQATYLIEAATAAKQDQAFYKVARSLDMDEEAAARFMVACREMLAQEDNE